MDTSQYIITSNVLNSEIYDNNDFNSFKNDIFLGGIDATQEAICEVALVFFECFQIKEQALGVQDYNLFEKNNIHLLRICVQDDILHEFVTDNCIAEISTNFKINVELSRLIYVPLLIKQNFTLHIKLLDERNQLAQLDEDFIYCTRCVFHIRSMSILQTKVLRLRSDNKENIKCYPTNSPLKFISKVYYSFHGNEDYTGYQVSVESIFISKAIMQQVKKATLCILICGKGSTFVETGQGNQIMYSSIKIKNPRKIKSIYIKPQNLLYFNVTKRLLDEIPTEIRFYNGATRLKLERENITSDMFIIINLIFRRKYAY